MFINFNIITLCLAVLICGSVNAKPIDKLTIVNGSYGGGWELTAKLTGESLLSLGLADSYDIVTLEGGAGWRALKMFASDENFKNDLLVQSEPLISGYLKDLYYIGFRDLKPVALMAAEYSCVVVAFDSPYQNFNDILTVLNNDSANIPISLGGRPGAGDHITATMIFKAANINNLTKLRYTFSDGGDNATVKRLIKKKSMIGVTGYNSIITQAAKEKKIRIIALTSAQSIDGHSTLKEAGVDIEYANWRGFFARKDINQKDFDRYLSSLSALSQSKQWNTILKENGWSPFFKSGEELDKFLIEHEKNLKVIMQALNII